MIMPTAPTCCVASGEGTPEWLICALCEADALALRAANNRQGELFVRSRKGSSRCVIDVYPRRARSAAVLAAAVPSRVAGWPVQGGLFGR